MDAPASSFANRAATWSMRALRHTIFPAFVVSLAQPVDDAGTPIHSASRPWRRLRLPLLLAALLILALVSLWSAWWSGSQDDWMWLWFTSVAAVALAGGSLIQAFWIGQRGAQENSALSLQGSNSRASSRLADHLATAARAAVLTGDDGLAPPVAVSSTDGISLPVNLQVLPPERLFLRSGLLDSIFYILFLALQVAEQVFFLWRGAQANSLVHWQFVILWPTLLCIAVAMLIIRVRSRRAHRVSVTSTGLRWRSAWGQRRTLEWSEIRAFSTVAYPAPTASSPFDFSARIPPSTITPIYVLTGRRWSLTWIDPQASTENGHTAPRSTRRRGAYASTSRTLVGITTAYGQSPLRDVSGFMEALDSPAAVRRLARPDMLQTDGTGSAVPGSSPQRRTLVRAVIFLLALAILLIGLATPTAQQTVFGAQLAQARQVAPQIRDPLTEPTLSWTPVPTAAAVAFHFTAAGYTFRQEDNPDCCDIGSYLTDPVGDGLLEVTIQQQTSFHLSEVGFVMRSSVAPSYAYTFSIDPEAEWLVTRRALNADGALDWQSTEVRREGIIIGVSAIHRGLDATNRLAVLMHGSLYLIYINGQFVGSYETTELTSLRQVGLYVDGLAESVTFSDLLLAPAVSQDRLSKQR